MRIALVSDTHLTDRGTAFVENWRATVRWLNDVSPDIIIHLGDISADGENDPADLTSAFREICRAPAPVNFLPGNHDIGDNRGDAAHDGFGTVDQDRLDRYRGVFGPDRWAIDADGWRLLGINAQLFEMGGAEEAAQWDWMERQVKTILGPAGVFLHKPMLLDGLGLTSVSQRYIPNSACATLLGILADIDLRFVASGHVHQARRRILNGVEHLWVPSTAFIIPDSVQDTIGDKIAGSVLLEISPDGHRFEFARPEGVRPHNMLDHADVYPAITALKARLALEAS